MSIEETKVWADQCPPWCDGGHLMPDWNSDAHMSTSTLMRFMRSGRVVRLRKKVRWLLPGRAFIIAFWSGASEWRVQMHQLESTDQFLKRAFMLEQEVDSYVGWLDEQLDNGWLPTELEGERNVL